MTVTETALPQAAPDADAGDEDRSFGSVVAAVASWVATRSRGDRAVLRRLPRDRDGIPPEVFWRIVDRYDIRPADESFWLAVLPLMVRHEHRSGARPGAVLARAGVSPARLQRWLRLDHAGALREADRFLSKVDEPLDWSALGSLLRFWTVDARRRLARDFFLSPEQREQSRTSTGAE